MTAVFTELRQATIEEIRGEPIAAEFYLDSLALLEDLTHAVIPELEPPRFTVDLLERKLDEITFSARKARLGEIADNLDLNRESWANIRSRVSVGSNRQADVAKYVHGGRTYREFVLEEAGLVAASESFAGHREHLPQAAVERSIARMVAAHFPGDFIADELGLMVRSLETILANAQQAVPRSEERPVHPGYGLAREELTPYYEPLGQSVFAYRSSNGAVYYLHAKRVTLRGGKEQTIYFFANNFRPADAVADLPDGYAVRENPRNGFLTLQKRSK